MYTPQKLVVIVICDGHRRDLLGRGATPTFDRLARRGTLFANHRSAFPSVTRCCSATIATGCRPARHGMPGNTIALPDGDGFVVRNVGLPEIFDQMRTAYGRVLKRPTLAERLAPHGGAIIVSNVSPGAAYMHDPEAFGEVYHRAGSRGPGGVAILDHGLTGQSTLADDSAITGAFCERVLPRRPALAVLWLSNPDKTMHATALGSDEHMAAVRVADACLDEVARTVDHMRSAGDDVLLLAGSDHGHQTVVGTVDVETALAGAGLKDAPDSAEVVVAPQGTAALIYVAGHAQDRVPAITAWLQAQPWCGAVFAGERLAEVGHAAEHGLAVAFSSVEVPAPSAAAPGGAFAFGAFGDTPAPVGFGQHGGLGTYEQSPVLIADGGGFAAGPFAGATDLTDIAPTVMRHLGIAADGMDGRPLQDVAAPQAVPAPGTVPALA